MNRPDQISGHSFDTTAGACTCGAWQLDRATPYSVRAVHAAYRVHLDNVWTVRLCSRAQHHVIVVARHRRGWTQTALAVHVSSEHGYKRADYYSQDAIARWEAAPGSRSSRSVPAEMIPALARVLEIDPLALVGGDPEQATAPLAAVTQYSDVLFAWAREHGALTIVDEAGVGWELRAA